MYKSLELHLGDIKLDPLYFSCSCSGVLIHGSSTVLADNPLSSLLHFIPAQSIQVASSYDTSPIYTYCPSKDRMLNDYPIAFKKFFSLISARLLPLIALVNSSLAPAASTAPAKLPSPAGKSIVCSYIGTLGTSISGFMACSLRNRFAATRRCFLDLAGGGHKR
jgi:hypothetical protein